jgi:rare lipoprotein A
MARWSIVLGLLIALAAMPVEPSAPARRGAASYEVFGQRYDVLPSAEGYRERGVASWYGGRLHGNPTASGEIYDMHALTAAHKTLPIPTDVRVTCLRTGKSIVVRVNDRGPFFDDRIIDLSYAAAQALGMVDQGIVPVEVRALAP